MYPPGEETRVRVGATATPLCGVHRPVHFEGVATIVTKLFALAGPCVAVFGRKDYQQLQVIRRLTADLFLPVEIVGATTVREPDGLAMSSRNAYLSPEQRSASRAIPLALSEACRAFARGERRAAALVEPARARLAAAASSVDYVDLADPESLELWSDREVVGERALLAAAVRLGSARLIDNVVLGEDAPPIANVVLGEDAPPIANVALGEDAPPIAGAAEEAR
jgi:pantoate--beta-alanine ligase